MLVCDRFHTSTTYVIERSPAAGKRIDMHARQWLVDSVVQIRVRCEQNVRFMGKISKVGQKDGTVIPRQCSTVHPAARALQMLRRFRRSGGQCYPIQ